MKAIRIVPQRGSHTPRKGPGNGRRAGMMLVAVVLCSGIMAAAQTVARSTTATQTTIITDPNKTTGDPNQAADTDPNALSTGKTITDPNQPTTTVTDPNQAIVNDPNQVPMVDPNQVPVSDPNLAVFSDPNTGQFNKPGNILIADQLNNRVIEVDRDTHGIVWQFGDGSSVAGPKSVVAPHDAERVGEWTLICGTGLAASTDPNADPNAAPCASDHRVLLVDASGKIIWQYGQTGVAGSDANQLNTPMSAVFLPYNHILIADQGNHRVIEVSVVTKQIVWQQGTTGKAGASSNHLDSPCSAQWLVNGNILIADQGNNRVIEVNRRHKIVWEYGDSEDSQTLNHPAYACRLPNRNTLITDSGNNRVLEVARRGKTVLEFSTTTQPGSVTDPLPWHAVRLENGNTLISDQFNDQVIEIDSKSNLVFTQGTLATPGNGFNQLNAPCDAKVIGDYTGLTPPSLESYDDPEEDPQPPDRGNNRGTPRHGGWRDRE